MSETYRATRELTSPRSQALANIACAEPFVEGPVSNNNSRDDTTKIEPSRLPRALVRTGSGIREVEYYVDDKRSLVRTIVGGSEVEPWVVALINSRRECTTSLIEDDKDSFVPWESTIRICGGCRRPMGVNGLDQEDLEKLFYHKFRCNELQKILRKACDLFERSTTTYSYASMKRGKKLKSLDSISAVTGPEQHPRSDVCSTEISKYSETKEDEISKDQTSDTETINEEVHQPKAKKGKKKRVHWARDASTGPGSCRKAPKLAIFFEGDMPEIPRGVKRAAIFEF